MSLPQPDRFGRFRVAETIDGKTRHYSTKSFIPGVHRIVAGPDAQASYDSGDPRPPKFNINDAPKNSAPSMNIAARKAADHPEVKP